MIRVLTPSKTHFKSLRRFSWYLRTTVIIFLLSSPWVVSLRLYQLSPSVLPALHSPPSQPASYDSTFFQALLAQQHSCLPEDNCNQFLVEQAVGCQPAVVSVSGTARPAASLTGHPITDIVFLSIFSCTIQAAFSSAMSLFSPGRIIVQQLQLLCRVWTLLT
jgi:hypothetical protein